MMYRAITPSKYSQRVTESFPESLPSSQEQTCPGGHTLTRPERRGASSGTEATLGVDPALILSLCSRGDGGEGVGPPLAQRIPLLCPGQGPAGEQRGGWLQSPEGAAPPLT